jgi:hypothetical protein
MTPVDDRDPYGLPDEQDQGYDPSVVDELGSPPILDFAPIDYQEPTTLQRLVEGFSGLEGQPQGQPHSFAEGLLQGFGRGLGAAGTRSQAQREKYNATAERRQLARDQANLEASRDYRTEQRKYLGEKRKSALEDKEKQAKYERENLKPTVDQLKQSPWLARIADENGRIPRQTLIEVGKPPKPDEPLEYHIEGVPVTRKEFAAYKTAQAMQANKPPTQPEQRAGSFYEQGRKAVDSIAGKGGVEDRLAQSKGVGAYAIEGPRQLQSADQQAYNDAVTSFAQNINYLESGAAVTPAEFDRVRRTYFWVPGDKPGSLERKRKLRQTKLEEVRKQGPKGGEGLTPPVPAETPVPATWREVQ